MTDQTPSTPTDLSPAQKAAQDAGIEFATDGEYGDESWEVTFRPAQAVPRPSDDKSA